MSAELADSSSLGSPLLFSPHSRVGIRQSADPDRAGKHPITLNRELRCLLPELQPLHEFTGNGERSAGAICLDVVHVLFDNYCARFAACRLASPHLTIAVRDTPKSADQGRRRLGPTCGVAHGVLR